jgi:membrane protein required for colicin V production
VPEAAPAVNWVDIGIGLVVLISAVLAFSRGFVHEVLTVAAWVGAAFATIHAYPYVQPYASQYIGNETAAKLAAGTVVFIVSLVVLSLLTRGVTRQVKDSALNALDRSLGFLFGIARGAVLVCLAYIVVGWAWAPAEQPTWLRQARSLPAVETGATMLRSLVPGSAQAAGSDAAAKARSAAEQAQETKRMLDQMMTPQPRDAGGDEKSGYSDKERNEMERLIESTGR